MKARPSPLRPRRGTLPASRGRLPGSSRSCARLLMDSAPSSTSCAGLLMTSPASRVSSCDRVQCLCASYRAWGDSLLTSPRSHRPREDSRTVSTLDPRPCASSLRPDPGLQTSNVTLLLTCAALETSNADTPTAAASGRMGCEDSLSRAPPFSAWSAPSPGTAALLYTSRDDSSVPANPFRRGVLHP
jgi:hypothetical protein